LRGAVFFLGSSISVRNNDKPESGSWIVSSIKRIFRLNYWFTETYLFEQSYFPIMLPSFDYSSFEITLGVQSIMFCWVDLRIVEFVVTYFGHLNN
jgi:hypothetical protein